MHKDIVSFSNKIYIKISKNTKIKGLEQFLYDISTIQYEDLKNLHEDIVKYYRNSVEFTYRKIIYKINLEKTEKEFILSIYSTGPEFTIPFYINRNFDCEVTNYYSNIRAEIFGCYFVNSAKIKKISLDEDFWDRDDLEDLSEDEKYELAKSSINKKKKYLFDDKYRLKQIFQRHFIKSDNILKSARYFTKYTNLKTILSLDGTKVYYLDGDREILIFDENEFFNLKNNKNNEHIKSVPDRLSQKGSKKRS